MKTSQMLKAVMISKRINALGKILSGFEGKRRDVAVQPISVVIEENRDMGNSDVIEISRALADDIRDQARKRIMQKIAALNQELTELGVTEDDLSA